MNDDTYQRLSDINHQLIQLCVWLNSRGDPETASRLVPITYNLTRLVVDLGTERK
jgi:hypothetical protein